MLIDTHCHLWDEAFRDDREAVVARALQADVQRMVVACCDESEFPAILTLCEAYPGRLFPTIGLHPENLLANYGASLDALERLLEQRPPVVAVGEVGLDLHWNTHNLPDQLVALERQVRWAVHYDLPLVLHIRDAMPEFLGALPAYSEYARLHGRRLRGVLHCYSGTADQAAEVLQWGDFLFGVGGTLTYRHSSVPDVARAIGLARIVVETDAPYLAPVPHRGRRNEPAYVAHTAEALAQLFGVDVGQVEAITTMNAEKLFNFAQK